MTDILKRTFSVSQAKQLAVWQPLSLSCRALRDDQGSGWGRWTAKSPKPKAPGGEEDELSRDPQKSVGYRKVR